MSAWGGRNTHTHTQTHRHTQVDKSALSLHSPSLPRSAQHTVDTQEAPRLKGQGQRWRGKTEAGEGHRGTDGAVKAEKLRTENHLDTGTGVKDTTFRKL